jgi:hypothetical protein
LEDVNSTETTQDVSPEAQLAENEQATYASANNDLKGTKAYQEADVPGLYNLAMAIIDYRGHRVVAQVCSTAQIHLFLIYSFFLSVGSFIILLYVQLSKKPMYDYLVILPMLFLFGLDNMV